MSTRKTIAISVVLLFICYFLYTRPERVQRGETNYVVITRIDAGPNRSITILEDDTPFEIPGWFYEINVGSQIVVPMCMLSQCCPSRPKFRLLKSTDQTLVGLVLETRPEVLLLVHDFDSGQSWPRATNDDTWQLTLARGRQLRDRLQADNPQLNLKLSHEVP